MYMSNNNNSRSTNRRVRRRLNVPEQLRNLGVTNMNIVGLYLEGRNLTKLPSSIGLLTKLREIDVSNNKLTSIPKSIGLLTKLKGLYLENNKLTSIPNQIGLCTNLEDLDLENNKLTSIPSYINLLENLEYLNLKRNKLTSIPQSIIHLHNLKKIDLSHNPNLKTIPREFIGLGRPDLRIIKNNSTKFVGSIVRIMEILKVKRQEDFISGKNFENGNSAVYLGHNKFLNEKSLLNWIKTKNSFTKITNINALYDLEPNTNVVVNPFTRQPLLRKNIKFVTFVRGRPLSSPPRSKKNLLRNNIRKKAGNAAQSRRTNVNNNNR